MTDTERITALEQMFEAMTAEMVKLASKIYDMQQPGQEVSVLPSIDPEPEYNPKRFESVKRFMETLWMGVKVELEPDHYFITDYNDRVKTNLLEYHHPKIKGGFDLFGQRADFRLLAGKYPILGDWMKEQFGREWMNEWYDTWGKDSAHRSWPGFNLYTGAPFELGCGPAKVNGMID